MDRYYTGNGKTIPISYTKYRLIWVSIADSLPLIAQHINFKLKKWFISWVDTSRQ